MTKPEIGMLLATAAAFDQRTTGVVDIDAWHAVIGHLNFEPARQAVITWYGQSRERIMPADILDALRPPADPRAEHMTRR